MPAYTISDIEYAKANKKTAVIFGFQNPSPIEDDIGLIEILHKLGGRFMQLTYNNQSLLASGCYEEKDNGLSRMGKEVIEEMNRVGMIIDMSHSGEKSTIEAIEYSKLPITISHANPSFWHNAKRNKSNEILKLLASKGGILGLSLYPHHLKNNSNCTLDSFCKMIVDLIELIGVDHIGFGSDLCQDQPDSVVEWMRVGRWTKKTDYGEGSASNPGFPKMPSWFKGNKDWENILNKLQKLGLKQIEIEKIKGLNWYNFFKKTKAFK
tara:strand:- start:150 stop:947 length:798 start_codon:yes stop_codon:yes gene_type:complete